MIGTLKALVWYERETVADRACIGERRSWYDSGEGDLGLPPGLNCVMEWA
jgi:hypothetical protein